MSNYYIYFRVATVYIVNNHLLVVDDIININQLRFTHSVSTQCATFMSRNWCHVGTVRYDLMIFDFICRRKFRSQTSDNMARWKSKGGKSQGGEVKKWEDQRRERVRSKKMQVREKVGKSRFTVFFQWFGAPEGRKVTSLKRRVRSQLARWEMKNCTRLWCEAYFQVKMHKTLQLRTTFGSWEVEKVHAFVARSTSPSQNVQNRPCSDHFWKLRCRKSAGRCSENTFPSQKCKNWGVRTTFGRSDVEKVDTD